jgi:hypothetical protein
MKTMDEDNKYNYALLGRLQMDCEYFINTTQHINHLWAGNIKDQIFEMKKLWLQFKVKPQWLSFQQIIDYGKKMKELQTDK